MCIEGPQKTPKICIEGPQKTPKMCIEGPQKTPKMCIYVNSPFDIPKGTYNLFLQFPLFSTKFQI